MFYHLISMTASAVPSAGDFSSATHVHSVQYEGVFKISSLKIYRSSLFFPYSIT